MNWYDKACEELEEDLYRGMITYEEFRSALRDLDAEWRESLSGERENDGFYC